MPLTFKRQTLIGAYDGDTYLGKLHEKADGLSLAVVRDGVPVERAVTEADLVAIAQLQTIRDAERELAAQVAAALGETTAAEVAAAAALVKEYGIRCEAGWQFEEDASGGAAGLSPETEAQPPRLTPHASPQGGSVLEDDDPAAVDPAAATMISGQG